MPPEKTLFWPGQEVEEWVKWVHLGWDPNWYYFSRHNLNSWFNRIVCIETVCMVSCEERNSLLIWMWTVEDLEVLSRFYMTVSTCLVGSTHLLSRRAHSECKKRWRIRYCRAFCLLERASSKWSHILAPSLKLSVSSKQVICKTSCKKICLNLENRGKTHAAEGEEVNANHSFLQRRHLINSIITK